MSLNKACLIGNVGQDPEIRSMNSGDRVANFSIATSDKWKDKQSGEKKERTEWHRIVVWGGLVEIVERYVKKGMKLYIEGQIQTRKWTDQAGVEKYSTEIVLRGFGAVLEMLTFADDGDGQSQSGGGYSGGGSRHTRPADQPAGGGYSGGGREDFSADLDDEIPF
jgi:single-strand DNA-binding protein